MSSVKLTALSGPPAATGASPASVAVDSAGELVYMTNQSDGTLSAYVSDDGVLNAISGSPFATEVSPRAVTVAPSGQSIYVVAVDGSPYATGSNPSSAAVDSLDKFVYVANQGSNNISAFTRDPATAN